jgi:pantothenate kinase
MLVSTVGVALLLANLYSVEAKISSKSRLVCRMSSITVDDAMCSTYDRLTARCLEILSTKIKSDQQYWIGIAGGPGSGKSTLSAAVSSRINTIIGHECCIVLPMDGFHYSRKELKDIAATGTHAFDELIARRGSPWTFNAERIVKSLTAAKMNKFASLPIYSRKLSDPVENGVHLLASHKLVLVEGNYLLNWDDAHWSGLQDMFEEKWFISCSELEKQRQRLIKRHLETWTTEKESMWGVGVLGAAKKADSNDVLNAQFVDSHRKYADLIVESI